MRRVESVGVGRSLANLRGRAKLGIGLENQQGFIDWRRHGLYGDL